MTTILVTGATDGIGRQTAIDLTRRGAAVIVHGRNPARIAAVVEDLRALGPAPVPEPVRADLASLADVRRMVETLEAREQTIDVLVNNAALVTQTRQESVDGHELVLAVNHLAPFLLTHLLLASPVGRDLARIVNVSSMAQRNGEIDLDDLDLREGWAPYPAYARSKLANILFTVELAARLGPRPTVNALHPGVVSTKLITEGFGARGWDSLATSARTTVRLALDPTFAAMTGNYIDWGQSTVMNSIARNMGIREAFYEESARRVGIEGLPPRSR